MYFLRSSLLPTLRRLFFFCSPATTDSNQSLDTLLFSITASIPAALLRSTTTIVRMTSTDFNYDEMKSLLSTLHSTSGDCAVRFVPQFASNTERDSNNDGVIHMDKVLAVRTSHPDLFAKLMLIIYIARLDSHIFHMKFRLSLLNHDGTANSIRCLDEIAREMRDEEKTIIRLANMEEEEQKKEQRRLREETMKCKVLLKVMKAYNERMELNDDVSANWNGLQSEEPIAVASGAQSFANELNPSVCRFCVAHAIPS